MTERAGGSPSGTIGGTLAGRSSDRLGEERAMQILERAAALDARRSSEFEVDQLREAAAGAGISPEAFEQAIREHDGSDATSPAAGAAPIRAPNAVEVAHYAGLLRDLLGEDVQVVVVEDRIEGRNEDGVTVSISPLSGDATAAITASGSLRRRLLALGLPAIIPGFMAFMLAMEEGDPGIGMMVGVVATVISAGAGTVVSFFRERKSSRRQAERLRRQLQRMLTPPS